MTMDIHRPGGNNQNVEVELKPTDYTIHTCECGSDLLVPVQKLGLISPLNPKNPTGKEQLIVISAMACFVCKKEFNHA